MFSGFTPNVGALFLASFAGSGAFPETVQLVRFLTHHFPAIAFSTSSAFDGRAPLRLISFPLAST